MSDSSKSLSSKSLSSHSIAAKASDEVVYSPCISICALDENDICIGCFRSAKEIGDWGKVDNHGKREILKNVARRMAEH
ncbi:MAG: DUF1289 domain-containing protein [Gammaproteobacteria bacterium]|nr:MAG: DUF1289 domain-containing protein [Gammaproteobacteria bacterium]